MIDYSKHMLKYKNEYKSRTVRPYTRQFINLASSSNTPVKDLPELLEKYKHQLGRKYDKQYRKVLYLECKDFINYMFQKQGLKPIAEIKITTPIDEENNTPQKKNGIKIYEKPQDMI